MLKTSFDLLSAQQQARFYVTEVPVAEEDQIHLDAVRKSHSLNTTPMLCCFPA